MTTYRIQATANFGYTAEVDADDPNTAAAKVLDDIKARKIGPDIGPAVLIRAIRNTETGTDEKLPKHYRR